MKIVFVMAAKLNTGRGTERVLLSLLKYKPKDVEAIIIEPNFMDGERLKDTEIKNFIDNCKRITVDISTDKFKNILSFLWDRLIRKSLYRDLRERKFEEAKREIVGADIVYLFSNVLSIFFDKFDAPIIGSNHMDNLELLIKHKSFYKELYYNYFFKLYYKNISGIHFFPKMGKYIYDNKHRISLNHSFVLPNGVDTSLYFPNFTLIGRKVKFLFVAALSKEKGLDILLSLIEKLKDNREIEFHIVGLGDMENKIKNNKNIIYHGLLSDTELASLYRESDIFIYPTRNDLFPLVVLQALSSGLYVLCSDFLRGVFDDFEGKFLEYIKNDYQEYYKKIKKIIVNRDLIKHNKDEEYNYVKNCYDWSIVSKRFYEYIKELSK